MNKSIFSLTILIVFSVTGCNEKPKKTDQKNKTEIPSKPKAEDKRVNITFDKKINDYNVSILWSPFMIKKNTIIGPAVLQFKNLEINKSIEIITDYFSIPSELIKVETGQYNMIVDVKPNNLKMNYKDFELNSDGQIGQIEMPFFFFDINFDGSKELIITEYGRERNFVTKYKVFSLKNSELANQSEQITDTEPYNQIYPDSKIDVKNKQITNKLRP